MRCILCGTDVDLFDLDESGYGGEPAHRVCATAARDAFAEACDEIARRYRQRDERAGRRYRADVA